MSARTRAAIMSKIREESNRTPPSVHKSYYPLTPAENEEKRNQLQTYEANCKRHMAPRRWVIKKNDEKAFERNSDNLYFRRSARRKREASGFTSANRPALSKRDEQIEMAIRIRSKRNLAKRNRSGGFAQ